MLVEEDGAMLCQGAEEGSEVDRRDTSVPKGRGKEVIKDQSFGRRPDLHGSGF
jgi:hypothetical protein